ncbi:MAG: LCP family protein [Chloroflexi bacterium]|nr:LCP family protein [Chloroflexota bacterium]
MRTSFDGPSPPGGHGFRWLLVATALVGFVGGVWLTMRVASFSDSVFGGSERPASLDIVEDVSEVTSTPAVEPAVAITPTAEPRAAVAAAPIPPTATIAPTATPVIDVTSVLGKLKAGKRVSLLLIGYGGPGHDGPYLTDALVVASYEPRTGQLALFNLPRDLWVQAAGANGRPAGPFRRINEIYGLGLGQAALDGQTATARDHDRAAWGTAAVAQQVLGLPIDGWFSADFNAVRRVVDGLGGVMVTVETAFDDYEYPRHDNAAIDSGVMHLHFDAGRQRLSGERALQYARSRHALQDGTDFGRARRQQRLLLALKDEALQPATLPKVFALMDAVQGHVRTNLSLAEARDLALYGRDHNADIQAAPAVLDTRELLAGTMTDGGASVLVPAAGAGNYAAIQRFVRGTLAPVRDAGPNPKA